MKSYPKIKVFSVELMIWLRTHELFKNSYWIHYYYENYNKKYSKLIYESIEIEFIYKHYLF